MSAGDIRGRSVSADNFFKINSTKIEGIVNDHARKDLTKEIYRLRCLLSELQGSSGWNQVAHYILDEDPRVQSFIMSEFRTLYGIKEKKMRRYTIGKTSRKNNFAFFTPQRMSKINK